MKNHFLISSLLKKTGGVSRSASFLNRLKQQAVIAGYDRSAPHEITVAAGRILFLCRGGQLPA
jgi:hypothetical protein